MLVGEAPEGISSGMLRITMNQRQQGAVQGRGRLVSVVVVVVVAAAAGGGGVVGGGVHPAFLLGWEVCV